MDMQTDQLIKLAENYAAHQGLKLSTVSTYAANDGKFLKELSDQASCTVRRFNLVLHWFSENWPEDLPWPKDIERPQPDKTPTRAA
jgi:hypothetical protein